MTREPLTHVRILIYRTWAIRNVEKTVLLKFFAGSKFRKKKMASRRGSAKSLCYNLWVIIRFWETAHLPLP